MAAVLSRFRVWWPEALAAVFLSALSLLPGPNVITAAVIMAVIMAIGWGMGFRHRHLPLAVAIRETHAGMRRIEDKIGADAPQQAAGPMGALIPFRRRRGAH